MQTASYLRFDPEWGPRPDPVVVSYNDTEDKLSYYYLHQSERPGSLLYKMVNGSVAHLTTVDNTFSVTRAGQV